MRLPNRVLAIGKSPNDIRLFESKNCAGRYACLSHCWGEQQLLKTTKQNLEAHLKSISWNTIPKTFQDAIRVAWHLDLEYLWIDSLCIIQGDADDWVRESSVMCDIYENAYITLAATSALNASVGLFLKDNGGSMEISGSVSPDTNFKLIMRRCYDHPSPHDTDIWPLFRRAWVLQERLLSPRVIHFNEHELVWECRQLTQCQCGESHELGKKEHYQTISRPTLANLIQTWHNIVEFFCPLKATFESDKLPALSGLARQIARLRPQARYLAGLWSDSLETDLLWHNYDSVGYLDLQSYSNSKPRWWRAPSWSWASTNAKVVYPLSDYYLGSSEHRGEILHLYSTVSDAQTELATKNATGQVKGGSIQIRGPTFEARSVGTRVGDPESDDSLSIVIEGKGQNLPSFFGTDDKILFDFPADPFRSDMGVPASSQRQIKCIRMARIRRGYRGPLAAASVEEVDYAMVVMRLSPSTVYQRIGMAVICRESEKEKDLQRPEGMWEERPSCFENGGTVETITIV